MSITDLDYIDDEFNDDEIEEINETEDDVDEDGEERIVYVKSFGMDINGKYIYHFYFSDKYDEVFSEGWGELPACNMPDNLMDIGDDMYTHSAEMISDIKLDLARNSCCFTMQDSRDHIIALAYENIEDAEEYPEPRIIIQFGDPISHIEEVLAKRDVTLKFLK